MRKYAAPLRLTWDWAWPPLVHPGACFRRSDPERLREIGAEIVRAHVLLLEVGYPDAEALLTGELASALEGFAGTLSLVLTPPAAARLRSSGAEAPFQAQELWLDATPGAGELPVALAGWPAVRFFLTAANLDAVAAGIERALATGATAISLPNLPLFGELLSAAQTASPTAGQLAAFASRIAPAFAARPGVDLRIHHYGLWQLLRAAGVQSHAMEAGGVGCQAGAALGYVDPAGVLYPCASLPVPLARIAAGAIREAWGGPELAALRAGIEVLPERCIGCEGEASCRGGCRGWAHFLGHSWHLTGPDCPKQ